jgi:ribosomal protein L11 methyltransferase
VLALAAARLGHAPVLACDDDPTAVEAARENAARNNCDIQVWQCDALYDELPKGIDLWLANLQLAPLQELAWRPDLPPRLIASGLLAGESFLPLGYRVAERRLLDGWEGLLLEREEGPR